MSCWVWCPAIPSHLKHTYTVTLYCQYKTGRQAAQQYHLSFTLLPGVKWLKHGSNKGSGESQHNSCNTESTGARRWRNPSPGQQEKEGRRRSREIVDRTPPLRLDYPFTFWLHRLVMQRNEWKREIVGARDDRDHHDCGSTYYRHEIGCPSSTYTNGRTDERMTRKSIT